MPEVFNVVESVGGDPIEGARVDITLVVYGWKGSTESGILFHQTVTTNETGEWRVDLTANSLITPANTYYLVTERHRLVSKQYAIVVPDTVGPHWAHDLLTDPQADVDESALSTHVLNTDAHHIKPTTPGEVGAAPASHLTDDPAHTFAEVDTSSQGADRILTTDGVGDPASVGKDTYLLNHLVDIRETGAVEGAADNTSEVIAAINKADLKSDRFGVWFPSGVWRCQITADDMAAKSCTLLGAAGAEVTAPAGITGYVIDIDTRWSAPLSSWNKTPFGGFHVVGDGQAGAANGGLRIANQGALHVLPIGTRNTGGPGVTLDDVVASKFDQLVAARPVGADANDVPYIEFIGFVNGCKFADMMVRSETTDPDGSTVIDIRPSATHAPKRSVIEDLVLEFQHTPDGGEIIRLAASGWEINMLEFDVSSAVDNPTNNCYVRVVPPAIGATGGNLIRGQIPGNDGSAAALRNGVVLEEDRNAVCGVRDFHTRNVVLSAGVGHCSVLLCGRLSGTDLNGGIIDNSGEETNVLWDMAGRTFVVGGTELLVPTSDTDGRYHRATNHVFQDQAGTELARIGAPGDITAQRDLQVDRNLAVSAQVDFTGLPTTDPAVAGRLWNDAGTVKVSAG